MWFKYGLKAQKLLAQGIALGIMAISKAPCKGKSFKNSIIKLLPLQGDFFKTNNPQGVPWARSFCPFRAYGATFSEFRQNFLQVNFNSFPESSAGRLLRLPAR